ncbi:MAG TPA: gluconate 2-dehydrogenase subunit 3 family protein [Candidatus Polarisedimenticolaceae bacterium]|nr:gluconate 2-dehydrogenase subunit 3 family protein [Candidatus Polarisedimenticolaceae bacterium]
MSRQRLLAKRSLLIAVLDTLVPAGEGFPESGALALDHLVAIADASAETGALLSRALDAIDTAAPGDGARAFERLGVAEREDVLGRVESSDSQAFDALVRHAYDGFYSHPATTTRLGLDPGPVQPRGHRIEAAALPDLTRVAGRGPIYRRA